jgi:DNA modification methylase
MGDIQQIVSWVYPSNTAKQHRIISWWNCKPDLRLIPQPYKNPTDKRIKKRIEEGKMARSYDWWEINQVKNVSKKDNPHPCPIPYELARRIILSTTKVGDTVCDPFAGSGTVLKAAKDLGRNFLGFDISEKYVEVARKLLIMS